MSSKAAHSELLAAEVVGLLDLQRKLLAVVAQSGPLVERMDRVCQLFEDAVPGMVATVMRLDERAQRLSFISAPSAPGDLLAELDHARVGDGNGSCAHAAWSGKATYVGEAGRDPHWKSVRGVAERFGVRSCWSAPVRDRDQHVCGTFALTSLNSGLPDEFHRQLLDLGALSIGLLFDQETDIERRAENDQAIRSLALAADASPNGILFIGQNQCVEWVNAGTPQLLEKNDATILGQPLHRVLDLKRKDAQYQQMLEALEKNETYTGTIELKHPGGKRWLAQLTATPRPGIEGAGGMLMIVDVTAVQRLSAFNVLLAKVDHALAGASDPDQLLQTLCELAVQHIGLSLAWIGQPDPVTGWFRYLAVAGPGKHYLDVVRISSRLDLPEGRGPAGATWNDGKSRFDRAFQSAPDLKPWAQPARDHGFAAIAVLPIRRGGALWAELAVYHAELDSFDHTLQQLLSTLALNISTGLDRLDLMRRQAESQALNESMLDSATVGVVLTRNRVILRANRRAADILGAASPDDLKGKHALDFYADPQVGMAAAEQINEAFASDRRAILEIDAQRLDGSQVRLRLEGMPFEREGYDEIWSLIDQSEQHRAQETQRMLANALGSVQEGVIITDPQKHIVYANDAFCSLTGYSFEQMRGRTCSVLQGPDTDPETVKRIADALRDESTFIGEILNYRKDGSRFWNLLMINPLRDKKGELTHFVGVQRDITDIRELNERLEYLAYHDELTGLPNRRALDRYFAERLTAISRVKQVLAVAIIDLDDFKVINDTHGHVAGDRLLKTVTERIRPLLHKRDFFARLGGDEFVIVFHERVRLLAESRLRRRFEDIGGCFVEPFQIGPEVFVNVGLSMGIALMPKHADAGGRLLRLADEALFRAKRHKSEKHGWWSIHGESIEQSLEASFPPYGDSAGKLLDKVRGLLDGTLRTLVENFYAKLVQDPNAASILEGLEADEFEHLKQRQVDHIRFLLASDINRDDLTELSSRIGRAHALIGVDSVLLMRWMSIYQNTLVHECNTLSLNPKDRYQLVQLLEHRLQDDLQAQLEALNAAHDRYAAVIDLPIPNHGANWNDAIGMEIRSLARLPGVSCGMVLRQNTQQAYSIEWSTGSLGRAATKVLLEHYGENDSEYLEPSDNSLISRCWHNVETISLANISHHQSSGHPTMPVELMDLGIRSAVGVPIQDEKSNPVALVLLFGSFPNQFESRHMRQFKRNLQIRGNDIWQRSMRPAPAISHKQAISLRRRLFNDGLCFQLQPVINLHTGALIKVEALARLKLPDGKLVGPDVFLPLLRQNELNALFERGLDIALGQLARLERKGLHIDMALNIAPSTLSEPNCFKWVMMALQHHEVAPGRLVLEILENQRVDRKARDATVMKLVAEGVRFAIDDLGSGYSSLRRLASLPFHALKVDQGLLGRLHSDPVQTISLISAVIQLGRDFGCEVIAEGLEDAGMTEVARLLGAGMGQGFAIAMPMAAQDLVDWSRTFRLQDMDDGPNTPLGALAFQWISLRHGSLHTRELHDCPLTRAMHRHPERFEHECGLHRAVHERPGDKDAARQLLEWIQDAVRERRKDGDGDDLT